MTISAAPPLTLRSALDGLRVVLVHDSLLVMRGAERTFATMADAFPGAPIATLLHDPDAVAERFGEREIRTSFLQRVGARQGNFRALLPLLPAAAGRLAVDDCDVVVSSSSAFAHGVNPCEGATHVCYCHTPFRYAWFERQRALREAPPPLRPALGTTLALTRRWTGRAGDRVTHFLANSRATQERIRQAWGRDCAVVHPPVEVERFRSAEPEDFLLVVGEVTAHKRMELALEAARLARMPIVVVGDGPMLPELRARYGDSASFAGRLDDEDLVELYSRALALVVPNVEEFGIASVEAQAAGRPVIGIDAGGLRETVRHGESGLLVKEQTSEALAAAMRTVARTDFDRGAIAAGVQSFGPARFRRELREQVEAAVTGRRPRGSGRFVRRAAVASAGRYDTLVVGAGFAGSIMAERLTSGLGPRVRVVDRRPHIAGNAYDHVDEHGVLVHRYGPHIFHTNADPVVEYLSRFTEWRPYEHRVLARVGEQLLPIPITRTTVNRLYGLDLRSDEECAAFYAARREPIELLKTSEDAVVAKVGRDLYEKFFRGYTRKQWERDPSELHASVCARIPVRTNTDDRYFGDAFQQMPRDGFTAMFERILDGIEVHTGTPFEDVRDEVEYDHLVWTGPIDEYFGHRFGPLPYRSLEFELRNEPTPGGGLLLPSGSLNYPSPDVPQTRVTEFRRITGQSHHCSTLAVEFPRSEGDPYYPVPTDDARALYRRYEPLAADLPDVTFVGRLARYQCRNMDQVVAQALATYRRHRRRLQPA